MTVAVCARDDRAFSGEAEELRLRFEEILRERAISISLGAPDEELRSALEELSAPGWDGYGAQPVTFLNYTVARDFLELLQRAGLPAPEIAADPDGEISFEWYRSPLWVFSISVGPDSRLSYAGLFGRNKAHGTEYFENEIPQPIQILLSRLLRAHIRPPSQSGGAAGQIHSRS